MAPKKKTTTTKKSVTKTTTEKPVTTVDMKPAASNAEEADWRKKFFVPLLIVLILVLAFTASQQLVVVMVNGKPISRVTLARAMEARVGEQFLDELITKELVMQEAKKRAIIVSDADIDVELDKIKQQFESSGQSFDDVLAMQGYTIDQVREEIRMQKIIEQAVGDQMEVTDEDIDAFIKENSSFLPEEQDTTDEAFRNDIRDQIKQQKMSLAMQTWLSELKGNANIQYFGRFAKEPAPSLAPMDESSGEMMEETSEDTTNPAQ